MGIFSSTKTAEEQIEADLRAHQQKVKEREARLRREEIELEREKVAFISKGNRIFDDKLEALAAEAIRLSEAAAAELSKLPPMPQKPDVNLVSSVGYEAWLELDAAYPAKLEAYVAAATAAAAPLARGLRALAQLADDTRKRCRELGFVCYQGLHMLREDQRTPRPGTALIAFKHIGNSDLLLAIANAAEGGGLTAAHAAALADLIREPPPTGPAPQPEPTDQAWKRVSQAQAQREHDAEMVERRSRGEAVPEATWRGQGDVERYIDRVGRLWPGGVTPTQPKS